MQVHFAEHACAAFDIACREQDLQEVQRLITAGANLDEQDGMGHTPLHVAAGSEEPGSGAGLSGCSQRQRLFMCADGSLLDLRSRNLKLGFCTGAVVAVLCEHRASVDIQASYSRETALHRAANEGPFTAAVLDQ